MPKRKKNGLKILVLAGAALLVLTCRNPASPQAAAPALTGRAGEISLTITDKGGNLTIDGARENLTIYKTGGTTLLTLKLTDPGYTCTWYVDGGLPKSTGAAITIKAEDYPLGGHTVLLVIKDDHFISWSKTISFTIKSGNQEN
jgi:hypothetical protein